MTENVAEAKAAIRSQILAKRTPALAKSTEAMFSKNLLGLLTDLKPKIVGCYLSFGSEPGTWVFIERALSTRFSIACPRTLDNGEMEFVKFSGKTTKNPLGFQEPIGEPINSSDLELLIAPALAIDRTGRRLGRGGGYFDKFLPKISCQVAGVVFQSELLQSLPTEAHDVAVDFAVTESEIVSF